MAKTQDSFMFTVGKLGAWHSRSYDVVGLIVAVADAGMAVRAFVACIRLLWTRL